MGKPTVLFLCTGNSARSQMAEGLLRAKAGDRYQVESAGTDPAAVVNPLAVEVMREIGIDISSQRPKSVKEFLGRVPVRHLVIVCDGANEACPSTFPGVITRDFWPIDDPRGGIENFRIARDEIASRIDAWVGSRE